MFTQKKGASVLDLHGVRYHTNDLNNDTDSGKKQSFFLCMRCNELDTTTFGHSSNQPMRAHLTSINHACMNLASKTIKTLASVASLDMKMSNCHRGFSDDPARFLSKFMALRTIKHDMHFSMCESNEWRMLAHHGPIKNVGFLRRDMIRKSTLEQCSHAKCKQKCHSWKSRVDVGLFFSLGSL